MFRTRSKTKVIGRDEFDQRGNAASSLLALTLTAVLTSLGAGCGGSGTGNSTTYQPPAAPRPVDLPTNNSAYTPSTPLNCPTGTQLTYANFGEGFFLDNCASCHSAQVTGSARYGAPTTSVFDTISQIQLDLYRVGALTIGGGNPAMPPGRPLQAEAAANAREWLGCGAPNASDSSQH